MEDKAKGKAREAAGALTGDEDMKAEGRAEQRKGKADKKAKAKREEAEANRLEREQKRQEVKDKGLLGGLGDTLSGR